MPIIISQNGRDAVKVDRTSIDKEGTESGFDLDLINSVYNKISKPLIISGGCGKIEDIKYGPVIFLCNEFFDSLPIKQIFKEKNKFFEKCVGLSNKDKKS